MGLRPDPRQWWHALITQVRQRWPRSRRGRVLASALVVLLVGLLGWGVWPSPAPYTTSNAVISVNSGPGGTETVTLDSRYFRPRGASAGHRVPAVLLAHGFGGSKDSVRDEAADLASQGYAVLTWTARGFGRSSGTIELNDPDYEVRDAQRLLDWLAARPEVRLDGAGDPRVGVVGGSYGGALALSLAGVDKRVDAIVPSITWHDLSQALLPQSADGAASDGVFKKAWAAAEFGRGAEVAGRASPNGPDVDPACGRISRQLCEQYQQLATTGRATPAMLARLRRASPAALLADVTAPTLLIQGSGDTLFPLAEADANAKAISAHGTPVRVAWFTGGHDVGPGPQGDIDRVRALTGQWLGHYVARDQLAPPATFTWSRVAGLAVSARGVVVAGYESDAYPGLGGDGSESVPVDGAPQVVANPAGGAPAALSSLPGLGALAGLGQNITLDVPGQYATFDSAPLDHPIDVVGAPQIAIRAAAAGGNAVLFAKLYDVDSDGSATLPGGQVAPIRLTGLPSDIGAAHPVTVTMPGIVHAFAAGHRLRLVVSSTDQAYATPNAASTVTVGVGGATSTPVRLPTVTSAPIPTGATVSRWALAGLVLLIGVGVTAAVVIARARRRRTVVHVERAEADTPLVVRGLRKEYAGGFVAVSAVDFRVERGQVVGLLGPNGAGKTTTLRVLMGLTLPTAGEALVYGHRLAPGAPVLSRVGALVEGPGFLPHLSGRDNLTAYWAATGRPVEEAGFAEALDIAGLGDSVERRVGTYSHGMRQRLAIAQAMLGLPDLLVLDEPTDGLDPPQIAAMRRVLRRYATDGRAVLVSSHLLAEVEQTCSHVVVVHKGEVVASGPVDDIVGDSPITTFTVNDPAAAVKLFEDMAGVQSISFDELENLVVDLGAVPRGAAVAALVRARINVDRVVPRRRLEDAFLSLVGEETRGSGDR